MKCVATESTFIFFDESTFSNIKRQFRGWRIKYKGTQFKSRSRVKSYNLLMECTKNQVLHSKVRTKITNKKVVLKFFKRLLKRIRENETINQALHENKIFVLMDNVSYHKGEKLKNISKKKDLIYYSTYLIIINWILSSNFLQ